MVQLDEFLQALTVLHSAEGDATSRARAEQWLDQLQQSKDAWEVGLRN